MKNKKIRKTIESLKKQRRIHLDKIENYDGLDDVIVPYWESEIKIFEARIEEKWEKLKRKNKSK